MAIEIERKFLVQNDDWRGLSVGMVYRQGYIAREQGRTVRVRIAGDRAYLTVKGPNTGMLRLEFEYLIPMTDALELLETLCDRPFIEKTRYRIPWAGLTWEVDEFSGDNQGLVLAEVELVEEAQQVELPSWVGREVTHDRRYANSNLSQHPFSQWGLPDVDNSSNPPLGVGAPTDILHRDRSQP
jgi:adenylate cyclase